MFSECRRLHEVPNAFNRIAVKETCLIIIPRVVSIGQTSVTHFARSQREDSCRGGHFVQPFE